MHAIYHALAWTWGGDGQGGGNGDGYLIFSGPLADVGLLAAVFAFYFKHRCHHCLRPARFRVGDHAVPVCHRHRERESNAG